MAHRFLIGLHSGQQLLLPGNYQPPPCDTHQGLKIRRDLTVGSEGGGEGREGGEGTLSIGFRDKGVGGERVGGGGGGGERSAGYVVNLRKGGGEDMW